MSDPERILVVDDTLATLEVVRRNLESSGYSVMTASDVHSAIEILETYPMNLVITDLRMPHVDGMELIRHIRASHAHVGIIMITGFATIETAVLAIREGAEDYLAKPFTDEELLNAVSRVLGEVRARRAVLPGEELDGPEAMFGLIGKSGQMQRVYRLISKAASSVATVLINGESGTGKELVARAIHYEGRRASAPFVAVNCAAIPDGLVESELFGHAKGAFTGATSNRDGFFVAADGGTIFLDEIAELTLSTQAKLLRVLEEGEVRLLGSDQVRAVDVRVVAATNKDLAKLVSKKSFREDLFFRLNVLTIDLPPLRERDDDILLLIRHFLDTFASQEEGLVPRFTDRVVRAFRDYHWPGNVRELQNMIQRLVVMADGEVIDVPDLPSIMRFGISSKPDTNRTLGQVELDYIQEVLSSVDGNKSRAAEILGIDRKTLREKLKHSREV